MKLSLERMLRDKALLTKLVMIGYISSLVFIVIGAYIILKDIFG